MNFPIAPPARADVESPQTLRGVTPRVVALSLLLAAAFGYVLPIVDVKLSNTYLGASHLPPGAIGVLLALLLVINPLLKLLSRRLAFGRNEVLVVYLTCLFSCLVPGHSGENFFVPVLIAPFYFATQGNKWLEFLEPYLRPWMSPALAGGSYSEANRGVVAAWYDGAGTVPWGAWLVPLAAWSALVLLSYAMLACLGVMLRAQWGEREALSFPLLKLPLEMTRGVDGDAPSFFRDNTMWIGAGVAALLGLFNGLHLYFPDVPAVPLRLDMTAYFVEAPWNQIGWTPLVVWPIVVGISFLLTAEVSFSLWFFYWFIKFQYIAAYALGYAPASLPVHIGATAAAGAKAFTSFQQIGAFLTYAGFVVWLGREHFGHIAARALGRARARPGEKSEALSYPVAFWGFWISFVLLVSWCIAAGMRPEVALMLWGGYLVIALVLSRVVAEGGLLFVQQGWSPVGAIAQLVGAGPGTVFPPSSIVPAQFVQVALMTDVRAFLLPSFVQSFKLAHDRKIAARPLLALIAAVTLVSFAVGIWMNVRLGYQSGGLELNKWFAQAGAQIPARDAAAMIGGARDGGAINWFWLGVGALFTWLLIAARARLAWFPFHPIGYAMALTGPAHQMWFSMFLGWGAKTLITRFGGTDSARRATPFFLGLALGDVSMMLFWLVVDGATGRVGHQIAVG